MVSSGLLTLSHLYLVFKINTTVFTANGQAAVVQSARTPHVEARG